LSFEPPPFSLHTQPQRPGELAELIEVAVDAAEMARVRDEVAARRLPVELVLYIAIEADRALDEAVDAVALAREDLIAFLDTAAANTPERAPRHLLVRPLEQYAAAIMRGLPDLAVESGSLHVRVPHRVAATWAHAAAAAAVPLERWLADGVRRARLDRAGWEAAAARTGRTLGEWVLLQATRCARSRSTSPQATASG
jgi:hypothetical protein